MELNTADTHAAASHETRAGTYAHTKCAILPQLLLLSSSSVTIAALPRDSDTGMGLYKQRGPSGRSRPFIQQISQKPGVLRCADDRIIGRAEKGVEPSV